MENSLNKLTELSKYLTNLESELSCYWQLNPSLLCIIESGKFVKINPAWEKVLGYTLDEIKNTNYLDYVHPDDLKNTITIERQMERGSNVQKFVNRYKCKDGSYVSLMWSGVYDQYSKKMYGIAVDITEELHKKKELTLKAGVIEAGITSVVIVDAQQINLPIIYVNPAFEKMTGYKQEEMLGKNCNVLQRELKNQPILTELRTCLKEKRLFEGTVINFRKCGELFYNHLRISPIFDDNGDLIYFASSQYDITSEILLKKETERSEQSLKTILNLAPVGIFLADFHGNCTFVNEKWCEYTGLTKDEAMGDGWVKAIHPDYITEVLSMWNKFIKGEVKEFIRELVYINISTNTETKVRVRAYFCDENSTVGFVEEKI